MNGNCIDIGMIQAFLDGETAPEASLKVSRHVAGCDECAVLLAQAEEENSLVFSVLDRELNTLVPTQRLWSRINESIAVEKSRISLWQRFKSFVTANPANPSFAAAAGVLVVFGLVAVVWSLQSGQTTSLVATVDEPRIETPLLSGPVLIAAPTDNSSPSVERKFQETSLSSDEIRKLANFANYRSNDRQPVRAQPAVIRDAALQYLPGEESYIKTIADLEQNVKSDSGIRASSQIAYQRDLAVVDDAINKMKQVVRKNPRNQSARQVLYSSYQDKIDLLNSAAQREELMASMQ